MWKLDTRSAVPIPVLTVQEAIRTTATATFSATTWRTAAVISRKLVPHVSLHKE